MIDFPNIEDLCKPTPSKIVFLVIDGLGGLPHIQTRMSELESAKTPNLDHIAQLSACGLTTPVFPGITPGSGPGHLALFGYDPVRHLVGRGVLEALGIGVQLFDGDVAARGNLCTVDKEGRVVDRRAGRIRTKESAPLIKLLDEIEIDGVDFSVLPIRDHRFALVMRGPNLCEDVSETDPQSTGLLPLKAKALSRNANDTASAVNTFMGIAKELLKTRGKANMALLRGFSSPPNLPNMGEKYSLTPAAIASYPMYRGLTKLAGMSILKTGPNFDDQISTLENHISEHDFFFLHYKPADTAGEDGDFEAKVAALEELDARIPRLIELNPDVLVIAGDHSTPSIMGRHSWHPVPLLVNSSIPGDQVKEFTEQACSTGSIGRIPATNLMMITLAHADKLLKFGP